MAEMVAAFASSHSVMLAATREDWIANFRNTDPAHAADSTNTASAGAMTNSGAGAGKLLRNWSRQTGWAKFI